MREIAQRIQPSIRERTACLILAFVTGASGQSAAQTMAQKTQALKAITDTADRICSIIKVNGQSVDDRASGALKIQVGGLLRRLAELKVEGAASRDVESYDGFLRDDLPKAAKDNAECKLKVLLTLQQRMLSGAPDTAREVADSDKVPSTPLKPEQQAPLPVTREGVSPDIPGKWTTYSPSPQHCSDHYYIWEITGDKQAFRDQLDQIDVEQILHTGDGVMSTVTLVSFHGPRSSEVSGTKWEYKFQSMDRVTAKRLSDGHTFTLSRCPS